MKFSVDHVGLAVTDLQQSLGLYRDTFGFSASAAEEVGSQGVLVSMLCEPDLPEPTKIELLEATHDDSPIGRFLAKHGPGLHHLALRVDNLDRALEHLRAHGCEVIGQPQQGAGGSRVAWVHPRSTDGVLLELLES